MIFVSQITVETRGRIRLDGVGMRALRGEVVAILGPNGAGKTTLLQAISGSVPLTRGWIRFRDRFIAAPKDLVSRERWSPAALARHRAYLGTGTASDFPYRVDEIVALGFLGGAPREASAVVHAALTEMGMEGAASRLFATLSSGQKQRVHFARALVQLRGSPEPRALVLDEPTSHLDLRHMCELMARARRFAADGGVVIAALHDPNLALAYADHVVVLERGRVAAQGSAGEVVTPELLGRVFGIGALRVPPSAGSPTPRLVFTYEASPVFETGLALDDGAEAPRCDDEGIPLVAADGGLGSVPWKTRLAERVRRKR